MGSVFFLLVVLLILTTAVLIFTELNGYATQSNLAAQQEQAQKGANVAVSGLTFGGILAPAVGGAFNSQANVAQKPLLPISNMNFTTNMNGWSVSRSYSLLHDNATVTLSPYLINATQPAPLPGPETFTMTVTNNDLAGTKRAIAYVSIAVDQNFTVSATQVAPMGWNTPPTPVANTIIWTPTCCPETGDISPQGFQTFTWTASYVPLINGSFFHTVTLEWIASPPDTLPYIDAGIATVNTTEAAVDSGGVSTGVLTAAPSNSIPGGAAGGFDATSSTMASQSGPGSLYGTFAPTFNGEPIPLGQQLAATLNYSTSFSLSSTMAAAIIPGQCCSLTWGYTMDELTSQHNPSIQITLTLVREGPPSTLYLSRTVEPTLVNYYRPTGLQYNSSTRVAFTPPPWTGGTYTLTISVSADLPGANHGSSYYPPSLSLHFDDIGLALRLSSSSSYYIDQTITVATNLRPSQVQGMSITTSMTGPTDENVSAYIYLEDVSNSQVTPFWVEQTALTFSPPATAVTQVPLQNAGVYISSGGILQARIFAISTAPFSLDASFSVLLKTTYQTTVVASIFDNSTYTVHLVSLYLSGPTGTAHFDRAFAPPNNFSVWIRPGQTFNVQEQYAWAIGQSYEVTVVSDQGVSYSGTFGS